MKSMGMSYDWWDWVVLVLVENRMSDVHQTGSEETCRLADECNEEWAAEDWKKSIQLSLEVVHGSYTAVDFSFAMPVL